MRLARFKNPNLSVEGLVAFMSKKSVPFLYAVQHMITGMQMYVLQLRRFMSDVFYK